MMSTRKQGSYFYRVAKQTLHLWSFTNAASLWAVCSSRGCKLIGLPAFPRISDSPAPVSPSLSFLNKPNKCCSAVIVVGYSGCKIAIAKAKDDIQCK
jgi:hypothetical protein